MASAKIGKGRQVGALFACAVAEKLTQFFAKNVRAAATNFERGTRKLP
jgi:hypothetical protein